jgi:hypothetical protein
MGVRLGDLPQRQPRRHPRGAPRCARRARHICGDTLAYEVSRGGLPPVASYVWLFGTSSTLDPNNGDDAIIGDCDHYNTTIDNTTTNTESDRPGTPTTTPPPPGP